MRLILFKEQYLKLIESGHKTQTIRLWKRQHVKAGHEAVATNYKIKIPILITSVEKKLITHLNHKDAIADGFDSLETLHKEIFNIYGRLDFDATVVKFKPIL